ncbi:MAG: hypothetical protein RLZZ272_697 [Actinomycetota bacterium]
MIDDDGYGSAEVVSLRDAIQILSRRRRTVLVTFLAVVVLGAGWILTRTPLYESRTELLIEPFRSAEQLTLDEQLSQQTMTTTISVATEQRVILSEPVRARAAAALGLAPDDARLERVRTEAIRDTRIVEIIAVDPDPVTAAALSQSFADAYLAERRADVLSGVTQARRALDDRIAELEGEIVALDREIEAARAAAVPTPAAPPVEGAEGTDGTAGTAPAPAPAPSVPTVADSLRLERDLKFAELAGLVERVRAFDDDPDALTPGGSVLRTASPATEPVSPRPLRDGLLVALLGLALGAGLAFVRDHLDDVVREDADVRRATGGRPILGRIPRWDLVGATDEGVTSLLEPSSVAAETYRELSANVRFLTVPRRDSDVPDTPEGRVRGTAIVVVSPSAGNGKSATAANLAVAAARAGQRVVLVDGDLRRPRLARRFGQPRSTGLSDVLADPGAVLSHLVKVGVPNLRFISAGRLPPNPAELLASPGMAQLNDALTEIADLVIYDTPAILAVPDALELARLADLALLVARHGVSTRREIAATIERLEQVGAPVAGAVVNSIDTRSDAYYYYYTYYYRSGYAERERVERPVPEVGPFDPTDAVSAPELARQERAAAAAADGRGARRRLGRRARRG